MTHGHLGADPEHALAIRLPGHPAVALPLLLSLLLMLLAAGCAMGPKPESPALDLQTAKSTTMANERDMIAVIPAGDIVETKQNQVSNLLGCSGGRHSWTGQINVFLAPGADGPGYVQKIKAAWTGRSGWKATERTTAQGETVVDIANKAGYSHGVDYSEKYNAIRPLPR